MEENKKHISNSLLIQRRRMNLSQKHVARMLGHRDTSNLSRYESGEMLPSLGVALKLSILYQTPLSRLFPELYSRLTAEIVDHPPWKVVPRQRVYIDPMAEAA
jgi:transcriptional regulator with XRE-family HTH domain